MGTFADYLATGRGAVAFRLVIEGCSHIFVTDSSMERVMSDGRVVVRGLQAEGIQIQESAYLAGAELNISLSSLQILETDGPNRNAATAAFTGWTPLSVITHLERGSEVLDTASSATLHAADGMNVGDYVHVGTEVWRIDSITPSGSLAADAITMTRACWRTFRQTFRANVSTSTRSEVNYVPVSSKPAGYAGRRVWLYGHGTDELALSATDDDEGYLIFRGILAADPELSDSRTWSLSIEPRTKLLDTDIGSGVDGETRIRGIYYPAIAPLEILFVVRSGTAYDSTVVASRQLRFMGFYEDQASFCDALTIAVQALLDAAPAVAAGGTWTARPGRIGGTSDAWELYYKPDSSSPVWVDVAGSPNLVDGHFNRSWVIDHPSGSDPIIPPSVRGDLEYRAGWDADPGLGGATGRAFGAYVVPSDQLRLVPRFCSVHTLGTGGITSSDIATWPAGRFYLDSASPYITFGTIQIQPPDRGGVTPDAMTFEIVASSSDGYVEPAGAAFDVVEPFVVCGSYQPTITLAAIYGSLTGSNLAEFMASILSHSASGGNIGEPFLVSDDVADWTAVVERAAAGRPYLTRRLYVFSKPRKLSEVIREECKLYGLYLALDVDGRIIVRQLPPEDLTVPSAAIDAATHTPDDDFGKVQICPDGRVSIVRLQSGYVPADDRWRHTWDFRAMGASSTAKSKGQTLNIAPMVRPYSPTDVGVDITQDQAVELVTKVLALFGQPYYHATVPVSVELHGLRIGDQALLTIPQLPYNGARGSTGLNRHRGWLVARTWQYGDSPTGNLTFLVDAGAGTAGYAPSLLVAYETSGSGTTWTFHCNDDVFGPRQFTTEAPADASFFEAGYKIVMREHDADSPRRYTGTVTSVVGDNVSIEFDEVFPGMGTASWIIGFDAAQAVTLAQRVHCFLADPRGRIQWSDGNAAAFIFS